MPSRLHAPTKCVGTFTSKAFEGGSYECYQKTYRTPYCTRCRRYRRKELGELAESIGAWPLDFLRSKFTRVDSVLAQEEKYLYRMHKKRREKMDAATPYLTQKLPAELIEIISDFVFGQYR